MDSNNRNIKNVCIFCGSSPGKRESYKSVTQKLGQAMVKRKYGLVYGGGTIGVMGFLANAIHGGK